MSKLSIESTNAKFWCDFIDWITAYPDGTGTTITIPDEPSALKVLLDQVGQLEADRMVSVLERPALDNPVEPRK